MFDELIMHTEVVGETYIKGGSPGYVPSSDDALNIPIPTLVKYVIFSLWDPTKGNTPSGVVDVFFL